jgi:hypothetical protein
LIVHGTRSEEQSLILTLTIWQRTLQAKIKRASREKNMPLSELLPTVNLLSHQDKLRLIHFLLLAVAKEEGCNLEPIEDNLLLDSRSERLRQRLSATEAVVWSPQADNAAVRALSDSITSGRHANACQE